MRLIDADAMIHELNNSHYPGAPYVDAGISIAVAAPEGGLKQEDASLISDIVLSQSSYKLADIRVVEVK